MSYPPESLPTIRPDGLGYALDGAWFDGFADREELGHPARELIARMAERHAPQSMSEWQRAAAAAYVMPPASARLRELSQDH